MKYKRYIAASVFVALLAFVGGFCYGGTSVAQAQEMPGMDMQHCSGQVTMIRQGMPMNNAVMPCCVDRHDDGTIGSIGDKTSFKTKFVPALIEIQAHENVSVDFAKKYNASSLSPPPEPDILSSVVKIE